MTSPEPIEHAALTALPGLKHAFFTRIGGVSGGVYDSLNGGIGSSDSAENIAENRARMAAYLDVEPARFLSCWQHHSADCLVIDQPYDLANRPRADAMVTRQRGIALAIGTADCGPILFADAHNGVIGGAHAGWKGAFTGVIESTVAAMEQMGAQRERVVAVLGPTISRHAYEVGPEFIARFLAETPLHENYFEPSSRAGHFMFDLPAFIAAQLHAAHVGSIHDCGVCTYGDARMFSYRRMTHRGEPDYGRQMSAIALA